MIAAILGWTKLPQWTLELIVILIVAGGIWFWQHERFEAGIASQQSADALQTQRLKADAANQTQVLQTRADMAEQDYEQEHKDNLDYRSSHPDQPVRLCIAAAASGSSVPKASGSHPGDASAGAAPADVPKVSDGNSSSGGGQAGPDIGPLLKLLELRADNVSGVLREYQKREVASGGPAK